MHAQIIDASMKSAHVACMAPWNHQISDAITEPAHVACCTAPWNDHIPDAMESAACCTADEGRSGVDICEGRRTWRRVYRHRLFTTVDMNRLCCNSTIQCMHPKVPSRCASASAPASSGGRVQRVRAHAVRTGQIYQDTRAAAASFHLRPTGPSCT